RRRISRGSPAVRCFAGNVRHSELIGWRSLRGSMADHSMSLPALKDLRARADRVIERAALSGTPRSRFFREQRGRLTRRLLPTLAMVAVATGAAAASDLFQSSVARDVTLAQGVTATILAALALGTRSRVARKSGAALASLAFAGATILI